MAPIVQHRVGGGLPQDHKVLAAWLDKLFAEANAIPTSSLDPVLVKFKEMIESDSEIKKGFEDMFQQTPDRPPYNGTTALKPKVRVVTLCSR
jgi:phosphatidylserine decarboxylase